MEGLAVDSAQPEVAEPFALGAAFLAPEPRPGLPQDAALGVLGADGDLFFEAGFDSVSMTRMR